MEKVLEVSKRIWQAMHEEDIDTLNELVCENAKYVHMGVTLDHHGEVDVIKNRGIVYKDIAFENADVLEIAQTTIVYTKLKLTAVVGGNEVVNPFVVTEVYVKDNGKYKMASMSYTRINY